MSDRRDFHGHLRIGPFQVNLDVEDWLYDHAWVYLVLLGILVTALFVALGWFAYEVATS